MSRAAGPLHSADLPLLLRALPPSACDRVAGLIVGIRGRSKVAVRGTFSAHSLASPERRGHLLIPDIAADLRALGRHETGPAYGYRDLLRGIAYRHGIDDNGARAPASVEREVLRRYQPMFRPDPSTFEDRGSDDWVRRVGYAMPGWGWGAYLLSPDWRVVTAVTLEIAAQRRIALTRAFRADLES